MQEPARRLWPVKQRKAQGGRNALAEVLRIGPVPRTADDLNVPSTTTEKNHIFLSGFSTFLLAAVSEFSGSRF